MILKLYADRVEVQNNFRDLPHKQLNLNYSSNDVQWNPRDGESFWYIHVYTFDT